MIIRAKFNKKNYLKYIGHLDTLRLFQRTFNRAGIPVKYSEGFNPHPRFSIANPLSVGIESDGEYMDIELIEKIHVSEFIDKMNNILPRDVQILAAIYPEDEKSISAQLSWALYEIRFDIKENLSLEEVEKIIEDWLNNGEIIISRLRKQGKRKVMKEENIRPLISKIDYINKKDAEVVIEVLMKVGDNGNLRPSDFMDALNSIDKLTIDVETALLNRKALYIESGDNLFLPI